MDRRFGFRVGSRPAHGLAVDGDDFERRLGQRGDPIDEAALKRLGLQSGEDIAQRVMWRRPVRKGQKATQQSQFLFPEPRDARETIGAGKHPKQRKQQNLVKRIHNLPRLPGIRQSAEVT